MNGSGQDKGTIHLGVRGWAVALVAASTLVSSCGGGVAGSDSRGTSTSQTPAASGNSTPIEQLGKESDVVPFRRATPGSAQGLKIGYISGGDQSPFIHLVSLSVKNEVERAGGTFVFCDSKRDTATALECAKTFKTQSVDGYLNYQADAKASPAICAAGPNVPVIGITVNQAPCQNANMGANNEYAGALAGQAVGMYFKQKFNCQYDAYVSMQSFANGETNNQRMGGYDKGFSSVCGAIHDERKIDAGGLIDAARTKFIDVLTTLPGKHRIIVVGINDDVAEGAMAAAKTEGRSNDIYVSAQGADPSSWCQIKANPHWVGDTAYFPQRYGEIGVPYLIDLIRGKEVPKLLRVPHVFLNAQNIRDYYQPSDC